MEKARHKVASYSIISQRHIINTKLNERMNGKNCFVFHVLATTVLPVVRDSFHK